MKKTTIKIATMMLIICMLSVPFARSESLNDSVLDVWNLETESYGGGAIDIQSIEITPQGMQILFNGAIEEKMNVSYAGIFFFLNLYNSTDSLTFIGAWAYSINESFQLMEAGVFWQIGNTTTIEAEIPAVLFGDSIYIQFPMLMFEYEDIELLVMQIEYDIDDFEFFMDKAQIDWYPNSIGLDEFYLWSILGENEEMGYIQEFLESVGDVPTFTEPDPFSFLENFGNFDLTTWLIIILVILIITIATLIVLVTRKPSKSPEELKNEERQKMKKKVK